MKTEEEGSPQNSKRARVNSANSRVDALGIERYVTNRTAHVSGCVFWKNSLWLVACAGAVQSGSDLKNFTFPAGNSACRIANVIETTTEPTEEMYGRPEIHVKNLDRTPCKSKETVKQGQWPTVPARSA